MARKSSKNTLLSLPSRPLVAKAGQLFLLSCAVGVVVLGQNDHPQIKRIQTQLTEGLAPVLQVAAAPLNAVQTAANGIQNWANTYSDNEKLRAENRALLKWQSHAKAIQVENDKLRALMKVVPERKQRFVSAPIISDHGSAFSNAALVQAGSLDGVEKDQAVISERGLIGRITEITPHNARVMLLTDMNSRIPVMNERTREKMILVGKGFDLPILSYVSASTATETGDVLISSGDGGVFPKGIVVGKVASMDATGAKVELHANVADVEYVSVVQYDSK